MKQKLKDLITTLKEDRRAKFGLGVIVVMILFSMMAPDKGAQRAQRDAKKKQKVDTVATSASTEAYQDLITGFKGQLDELQTQQSAVVKGLDDQRKKMEGYEERTAAIFKKLIERMSEGEQRTATARGSGQQGNYPDPVSVDGDGGAMASADFGIVEEGLESFGNETVEAAPPPPPAPSKVAFVGAGDSVKVRLLAGVNAPTDGTPYPVVFKMTGNVIGPDGSNLPLGEARVVAAAQGSLTDSRALFRLTELSVRLPDGRRRQYKVDGWVVGEDGVRGMQGILLDPIGKAIGAGALTGGLEGFGKGVRDSQLEIRDNYRGTSQLVTGDIGKYAAGAAIAGSAKNWSGIVQDRLADYIPHVQVLAGRDGTAVFSKSVTIDGLFESMEDSDTVVSALD